MYTYSFLLFLCCLLVDFICLPYCCYCVLFLYFTKENIIILYWYVWRWTQLLLQRNTCAVFLGEKLCNALHLSVISVVYKEYITCKSEDSVVCCICLSTIDIYINICIFVNLEYKYIYYQSRLYITILAFNKKLYWKEKNQLSIRYNTTWATFMWLVYVPCEADVRNNFMWCISQRRTFIPKGSTELSSGWTQHKDVCLCEENAYGNHNFEPAKYQQTRHCHA